MTILTNLQDALKNGISAGAAAAKGQGENLAQDAVNAIEPNLQAIVADMAAIAERKVAKLIPDQQAIDMISDQLGKVPTLIEEAAALVEIALQAIIDAVLDALKTALGAATGLHF